MPADAFISFDHDDQQQVAGFRLLKSNPDCRLSRSKQSKQLRVDLLISTGRGSDFSGPLHWRSLSSSWPPILVGNPEITPRLPHHPEFSEIHAHLAFGIPECGVLPGNPSPSLEKVVFLPPLSAFVSLKSRPDRSSLYSCGRFRTPPTKPIPLPGAVVILIFSPDLRQVLRALFLFFHCCSEQIKTYHSNLTVGDLLAGSGKETYFTLTEPL